MIEIPVHTLGLVFQIGSSLDSYLNPMTLEDSDSQEGTHYYKSSLSYDQDVATSSADVAAASAQVLMRAAP